MKTDNKGTNMSRLLYRDPNASIEDRVEHLLALMTLDEKLAQLGCLWSTAFVSTGTFDPNTVAEQKRFVTEPGAFTFSIGGSWADIRAEQIVILDDQVAQYRQREIVGTKVQGG